MKTISYVTHPIAGIVIIAAILLISSCSENRMHVIDNEIISVVIRFNKANIPYVSEVIKKDNGSILFTMEPFDGGVQQVFGQLSQPDVSFDEDADFKYWQASARNDSIEISWQYRLLKNTNTFSSQINIRNLTGRYIQISRYPIAEGIYGNVSGSILKYWKALSYEPVTDAFSNDRKSIRSERHSSDYPNELPYWEIETGETSIFHALAWSGGWEANFLKDNGSLHYSASLPPDETQLTLDPGEVVQGPEILITSTDAHLEMQKRQIWLKDREAWASALYNQPVPSNLLIYNTWYAIRRDLSKEFIVNQLEEMRRYGFDAFVVDDGWFVRVGQWDVCTEKLPDNALYEAFQHVKDEGILAGIWSCPQLIATEDTAMYNIDFPGHYVRHMDAWLLDMAGMNFTGFLTDHVNKMVDEFGIDWWKYDQDFFAHETRHGRLKNVLAFQNALARVRMEHPGLYIENCMSGGRMVNEFTNAISQIHWPKDKVNEGLEHAWSNFTENLGALQMMQPYMNQKWVNNPEKIHRPDTSLIRFYAQSCLPGSFGFSADLYSIPAEQQVIFIKEAENYKKLEPFKKAMLYEIKYPQNEFDYGYIVFYNQSENSTAIIYGRKHAENELEITIPVFASLDDYKIKDIPVRLKANQHSGIRFFSLSEL